MRIFSRIRVFNDPAFEKYHAKFEKPKEIDVSSSQYDCPFYRSHKDTLDEDSLVDGLELRLDANGEPIKRELAPAAPVIQKMTEPEPQQQVTLKNL